MGARLAHGSCRRRRDAQTLFHVLPVHLLGTRATGGCWKTEPWTIEWTRKRKICYKYLVGYCNNQGPDEVTKNRQKTEPERTIYKVNNTIPRVQVKKTSDNHQITQDIHFLYKRLSMLVPNTIFQTADNNIHYAGHSDCIIQSQTKDIHIHKRQHDSPIG